MKFAGNMLAVIGAFIALPSAINVAVPGLVLGLIVFALGAILVDMAKNTEDRQECPYCAEMIRPRAKMCRYCGHDVTEVEAL